MWRLHGLTFDPTVRPTVVPTVKPCKRTLTLRLLQQNMISVTILDVVPRYSSETSHLSICRKTLQQPHYLFNATQYCTTSSRRLLSMETATVSIALCRWVCTATKTDISTLGSSLLRRSSAIRRSTTLAVRPSLFVTQVSSRRRLEA